MKKSILLLFSFYSILSYVYACPKLRSEPRRPASKPCMVGRLSHMQTNLDRPIPENTNSRIHVCDPKSQLFNFVDTAFVCPEKATSFSFPKRTNITHCVSCRAKLQETCLNCGGHNDFLPITSVSRISRIEDLPNIPTPQNASYQRPRLRITPWYDNKAIEMTSVNPGNTFGLDCPLNEACL